MHVRWGFDRIALAIGMVVVASHVSADELGARYEQNTINGEGVLNGAVLNGAWQSSFAATYQDLLGVMDRPHPDYEAKGLPLGGFRLFPTLNLGLGYTDNVFFTEKNTQGDYLYSFAPELTIKSQWAEDSLVFYGGLQQQDHDRFGFQDLTNWHVGTSGRFVVLHDTDIRANYFYDLLHEPLESPNTPGNAAQPTEFSLNHVDAAIDHKPDRFGITIGGALDDYLYQPTPLVGGGLLNNRDRNETYDTVFGRASYDFSPGYTGFLGVSYDNRNFLLEQDRTGVNRDSSGYQFNAGVDMLITRLIRGQLFVGYQAQNFKAPLQDVRNLNYGADLNWYATEFVTVHLSATRAIDDTTVAGASATDDQTVSVGADYELLRNLIIQGSFGYTHSNFIGISRHDSLPGAGLGLKWLINHYVSANLDYEYIKRDTNSTGQDFSTNSVLLQLHLQM